MKIITIKVVIPNKDNLWKVSIGKGRPRKKKNSVEIFRQVERFLTQKLPTNSASEVGYKIKICGVNSITEHLEEKHSGLYPEENETLYCLAVFLENYLPHRYSQMKSRLYGKTFVTKGGDDK